MKKATKKARLVVESLEGRELMASALTASFDDGLLRITGTTLSDQITVRQSKGLISVAGQTIHTSAGNFKSIPAGQVRRIQILGLDGNDSITIAGTVTAPASLDGGAGNDKVSGGAGNDSITGGDGNDKLSGGTGNDSIWGGAGYDRLDGGVGDDFLYGGGGIDSLTGGAGNNTLEGDLADRVLNAGGGTNRVDAGDANGLAIKFAAMTPAAAASILKLYPAADAARILSDTNWFNPVRARQVLQGYDNVQSFDLVLVQMDPHTAAAIIQTWDWAGQSEVFAYMHPGMSGVAGLTPLLAARILQTYAPADAARILSDTNWFNPVRARQVLQGYDNVQSFDLVLVQMDPHTAAAIIQTWDWAGQSEVFAYMHPGMSGVAGLTPLLAARILQTYAPADAARILSDMNWFNPVRARQVLQGYDNVQSFDQVLVQMDPHTAAAIIQTWDWAGQSEVFAYMHPGMSGVAGLTPLLAARILQTYAPADAARILSDTNWFNPVRARQVLQGYDNVQSFDQVLVQMDPHTAAAIIQTWDWAGQSEVFAYMHPGMSGVAGLTPLLAARILQTYAPADAARILSDMNWFSPTRARQVLQGYDNVQSFDQVLVQMDPHTAAAIIQTWDWAGESEVLAYMNPALAGPVGIGPADAARILMLFTPQDAGRVLSDMNWFSPARAGQVLAQMASFMNAEAVLVTMSSTASGAITGTLPPIERKWFACAGSHGPLGSPISDLQDVLGGQVCYFENGAIFSSSFGTFEVDGAIWKTYQRLKQQGQDYGLPTSDPEVTGYVQPPANIQNVPGFWLTGIPAYQQSFQNQKWIQWNQATDYTYTWDLGTAISKRYLDANGPRGILGTASSDELQTVNGGRVRYFEGGSIYWWPSTGAFVLYGAISTQYRALLGPAGRLGMPTGDTEVNLETYAQHFEHGLLVAKIGSDAAYTFIGGADANPCAVRNANFVFQDSYMRAMVGTSFAGADNDDLRKAMFDLYRDPQHASAALLRKIAYQRQRPVEEITAEYMHFLDVLGTRNDNERPEDLYDAGWAHMASTIQLRFGKVLGDVFGIDPVFGALLDPTGGIVGPGNVNLNPMGSEVLRYHGIFHDAGGTLQEYFGIGPGSNTIAPMVTYLHVFPPIFCGISQGCVDRPTESSIGCTYWEPFRGTST